MTIATKRNLRSMIAHVCAFGVAAFFLYAACPKIVDPRQFRIDISNYKILPDEYTNLPALFLPWLEAFAALALVWPRTRRAGAVLIAGLLLFFIWAVYDAAIVHGLDISCGCTGKDSGHAGWTTIIRNLVLLAATGVSVFLPAKSSRAFMPVVEVPSEIASSLV